MKLSMVIKSGFSVNSIRKYRIQLEGTSLLEDDIVYD